jgi:hypothetical protein
MIESQQEVIADVKLMAVVNPVNTVILMIWSQENLAVVVNLMI